MNVPLDLATETPLRGTRVLDLTSDLGAFCGFLLAGLGADVLKLEPPGGDPARSIGPFVESDLGHRRDGLRFLAYNLNKRSALVDLSLPEGRATFARLARDAELILEDGGWSTSIRPATAGALDPRGPIWVSLTPFGLSGPYANFRVTDLVVMAMAGFVIRNGYPDTPPVRIGVDQLQCHLGQHAAAAALAALYQRRASLCSAQWLDVSAQAAVATLGHEMIAKYLMEGQSRPRRTGPAMRRGPVSLRLVWPCKDGFITWRVFTGHTAGRRTYSMLNWMALDGLDQPLRDVAWTEIDINDQSQAEIDRWEAAFQAFFLRHTKAELEAGGMQRRLMIYATNTIEDILTHPQFTARDFFRPVFHAELNRSLRYPGPVWRSNQTQWPMRRALRLEDAAAPEWLQQGSVGAIRDHSERAVAGASDSSVGPLQGVRILDLSWSVVGPLAGKLLGEYGAEVIKVESASRVDPMRPYSPYKDGIRGLNRSGAFAGLNSGKRSLTLNLKDPGAIEIALRLVKLCDVVLENFTPKVKQELGLSFDRLSAARPDIILVSMSSNGQNGPQSDRPGLGFHLQAMAGFNHVTGWPDREPFGSLPYTDYIAAPFGTLAAIAALEFRRRTGLGQFIDLSQVESAVHFLTPAVLDFVANGREFQRAGNSSPHCAPHGVYPARGEDDWIAIAVPDNTAWRSLAAIVEAASPERLESQTARQAAAAELDAVIAQWTMRHDALDAMRQLQAAGIPAGIVANGRDLYEDPQLGQRGFWVDHPHAELEVATTNAGAALFSNANVRPRFAAPMLGEHNTEICTELLDMSDEEFLSLFQSGALR